MGNSAPGCTEIQSSRSQTAWRSRPAPHVYVLGPVNRFGQRLSEGRQNLMTIQADRVTNDIKLHEYSVHKT